MLLFFCIQIRAFSSKFLNFIDLGLCSSDNVGNDTIGNVRHVSENIWMTAGKEEEVQHQSISFLNNTEKGFYDKTNLLHRNQSELVGSDTLPSFPTQERFQFHQHFTSRYFLALFSLYCAYG
jgi:hypothetical protein